MEEMYLLERNAKGAKEGVDALLDFLAEAEDGFRQISDAALAQAVLLRLLKERRLTPAEMLERILCAHEDFRTKIFLDLAAFYRDNREDATLWREFGMAAGEITLARYEELQMKREIILPIIRDALGIEKEETTN